jgi:hypothetical protein
VLEPPVLEPPVLEPPVLEPGEPLAPACVPPVPPLGESLELQPSAPANEAAPTTIAAVIQFMIPPSYPRPAAGESGAFQAETRQEMSLPNRGLRTPSAQF